MRIDDMHAAINEAKGHLNTADHAAGRLAELLVGRLRKVGSGYVLEQLKRELRGFNMHTKTWRK